VSRSDLKQIRSSQRDENPQPAVARFVLISVSLHHHKPGGLTMQATALNREELNRPNDDGCTHGDDTDLWVDLGGSD
jgi:hypothetical protein